MVPESPNTADWQHRLEAYIPLLLCLLAAITYIASLRFEFVYDDKQQIVENGLIRSWHYIPLLFKTDVWRFWNPDVVGNYWRPLFMVWLVINYKLFGLNPVGWHATSVGLHVLATYLSYRVTRTLSGNTVIALLAAAIFAVHPVHIETVAWVSGATDSLMTLFVLLSLWSFIRGCNSDNIAWYLLSVVLFGCGLLCKEPAVALPFLAAFYVLLFNQHRPTWRIAIPFSLYALVFAMYWVARNAALSGISHSPLHLSLQTLLFTWPSLLWFYLKHLLWPTGLSLYYDQPPVLHPTWSHFWLPLVWVCLVFTGIALLGRTSHKRLVIFATALLLLPLGPAFVFPALVPTDYAHDRYLYLSCLGFGILIAIALQVMAASRRRVSLMTGIAVVLGFSIAGSAQVIYWANDVLLFDRATRIAPGNLLAFDGLGRSLLARGRTKEAVFVYSQVLKANPNNPDALYNLALYHFLNKEYAQSDQLLTRLVERDRPTPDALTLYADTLNHEQKYADAEPFARKAAQLRPNVAMYRRVLAESLAGQGKNAEARQVAEAALQLEPEDSQSKAVLDRLQTQTGR